MELLCSPPLASLINLLNIAALLLSLRIFSLAQKLCAVAAQRIIKMLRINSLILILSLSAFQCARSLAALRLLVNFSMLLLYYFLSAAALIKHTNEEILLRQTFCSSFHCVSADDALIWHCSLSFASALHAALKETLQARLCCATTAASSFNAGSLVHCTVTKN